MFQSSRAAAPWPVMEACSRRSWLIAHQQARVVSSTRGGAIYSDSDEVLRNGWLGRSRFKGLDVPQPAATLTPARRSPPPQLGRAVHLHHRHVARAGKIDPDKEYRTYFRTENGSISSDLGRQHLSPAGRSHTVLLRSEVVHLRARDEEVHCRLDPAHAGPSDGGQVTRNRIFVATAIVLALAVYAFGPRLLAHQSDSASNQCAEDVEGETSSIGWRVFPVAGWVCQDADGKESYLGWWV